MLLRCRPKLVLLVDLVYGTTGRSNFDLGGAGARVRLPVPHVIVGMYKYMPN